MKILKIFFGILAGFWCLGILLKFIRNWSFYAASPLLMSHLFGVVAGLILTGLLSYVCFRSAFKTGAKKPNLELEPGSSPPIADPAPSSRRD